jgi:hypothetical protein
MISNLCGSNCAALDTRYYPIYSTPLPKMGRGILLMPPSEGGKILVEHGGEGWPMLTTCPECSGKLSTAAPSCPHCGYERSNDLTAASAGSDAGAKTELLLPAVHLSEDLLKRSTKQTLAEWRESSAMPMLAGALLVIVALSLISLVILWALQGAVRATRAGQIAVFDYRIC